ncbi:uncharacterized protein [Argopecten irradians]|uniref:uncharacterized protein n=1 Tax=Argopecten irradians TaxID=31199 RepID=UPI0037123D76
MASPFNNVQMPFRVKGQITCMHHIGKELELYCKQCETLACKRCLSTVHDSHALRDLCEIIPETKQRIRSFVDKAEKEDMVQIGKYVTSIDQQVKENTDSFDELSHQIITQNNRLKEELDLLTAQTLSHYKQIEEDNVILLQTYKHDLEKYNMELTQLVRGCKEVLQTGSNIDIHDTEHEIRLGNNLPLEPLLCTVSFIPNKDPQVDLDKAIGKFMTCICSRDQAISPEDQILSVPIEQLVQPPRLESNKHSSRESYGFIHGSRHNPVHGSTDNPVHVHGSTRNPVHGSTRNPVHGSTDNPVHGSTNNPVHGFTDNPVHGSKDSPGHDLTDNQLVLEKKVYGPTLLPQTKLLAEWKSRSAISIICPTDDGLLWSSYGFSHTLILQDRQGAVKQNIPHRIINDMCTSPATNTIWVCDEENNVIELVAGQLEYRFDTERRPRCICITSSNHVVVGMTNHVTKFTTDGKRVLSTLADENVKPLVCTPLRVTECPLTRNLAVAHRINNSDGEEYSKHIVVIDEEFNEQFVYDGKIPDAYFQASMARDEPFDPRDVVYDKMGNLVIGDHDNRRLLLISGFGDFLRILHTDTNGTVAVAMDKENILWAIFGLHNVKQLQYYTT